jgi:hypothetical protein
MNILLKGSTQFRFPRSKRLINVQEFGEKFGTRQIWLDLALFESLKIRWTTPRDFSNSLDFSGAYPDRQLEIVRQQYLGKRKSIGRQRSWPALASCIYYILYT